MSNAQYIEIDSTYRNRKQYPLPSNFVVPISQTGRKDNVNASDPVSTASAELVWIPQTFNVTTPGANLVVTVSTTTVGTASSTTKFIVESAAGTLQLAENYYRGAIIQVTGSPASRARITHSKYLGIGVTGGNSVDRAEITVDSGLPIIVGTSLTLKDPTNITSTVSPLFFVPSGNIAPNAYPGQFIYNQTKNEYRPIKNYNFSTFLLEPDTSGSATSTVSSGPTTAWDIDDTYSIRAANPRWCGQLDITTTSPYTFPVNKTSFNLPITPAFSKLEGSFVEIGYERYPATGTTGAISAVGSTSTITLGVAVPPVSSHDEYYTGCQIRLSGVAGLPSGEIRTITAYNGTTREITVSPAFSALPTVALTFQIICGGQTTSNAKCTQTARRIVKYIDYRDVGSNVVPAGNTIDFPTSASDVDNFYNGLFIKVAGELRKIVSYTIIEDSGGFVLRRIAQVDEPFSGAVPANPSFTITSGIVESFSASLYDQNICILPFSYDNLNPLSYSGSLVSQQESVCYEIELLNLILPNQTLNVSEGGLISYYPYVYVRLSNIDSAGGSLKNILYSNNPNSTNILFRCAIDDVPNPINSTFIKIDGDGARQTIKFKPNNSFHFSVYMPNGELFDTTEQEMFSPCRPNPRNQISAHFCIKRL